MRTSLSSPMLGILLSLTVPLAARAQQVPNMQAPLQVEAKIALGDVRGRIDHLAVDIARRRLFVAELGNDSLAVVDLARGAVERRITGLREPQGVAYIPGADVVLVANAKDGTVERYRGTDLTPVGRTALGADADNLRSDPGGGRLVWVGHGGVGHGAASGNGGLTALDATNGQRVGMTIPLSAHPEAFQLEAAGTRAYVNLPGAGGSIAVLDRAARRQVATWALPGARANFPMALDERGGRLFVGFRGPATLGVLDLGTGVVLARIPLCEDVDDIFLDQRRSRLYAICGEGVALVLESSGGTPEQISRIPRHLARVPTAVGARTGLFVPDIDRLYVAVRAAPGEPAAVWVLRPEPQ